jgi:hypothetical protein
MPVIPNIHVRLAIKCCIPRCGLFEIQDFRAYAIGYSDTLRSMHVTPNLRNLSKNTPSKSRTLIFTSVQSSSDSVHYDQRDIYIS